MTLQGGPELNRRLEALRSGKATSLILHQFGGMAVKFAKDIAESTSKKTGHLMNTIRVDSVDEASQQVTVKAGGSRNVGYAAYVEFGTRPHLIVPVNAKVLAWGGARRLSGTLRKGAKATSFARRVHHPGSRPKPYLVPGAKKALAEVGKADAVIKTWNEAA